MNKGKKLLCLLLTMILCLSNALPVAAFSTEPTTPASTTTQAVDADTAETVTEMKTHVVTSGSDADLAKAKSYYVSVPATKAESALYYEAVVPIKLSKKGILVSAFAFDSASHPTASTPYVELYTDASCTSQVYGSSTAEGLTLYTIKATGTYYVKFKVMDLSSDGVTPYDFKWLSQFVDASNRTLSNKKEIYAAVVDSSKYIYYKVNVTKTGTLSVSFDSDSSVYATLCNSKKKAISESCSLYSTTKKATFAVKKGTYYYRVKASSRFFYVKSTFTAVTEKGGTTKKKARSIKVGGSTVTAPIVATNSKSKVYWYKFYNKKSKEVVVHFKGNVSSGSIQLEFFDASGESFCKRTVDYVTQDASFQPYVSTYYSVSKNLPKGTYYIKITKKTTKTSGSYSIKVK